MQKLAAEVEERFNNRQAEKAELVHQRISSNFFLKEKKNTLKRYIENQSYIADTTSSLLLASAAIVTKFNFPGQRYCGVS